MYACHSYAHLCTIYKPASIAIKPGANKKWTDRWKLMYTTYKAVDDGWPVLSTVWISSLTKIT